MAMALPQNDAYGGSTRPRMLTIYKAMVSKTFRIAIQRGSIFALYIVSIAFIVLCGVLWSVLSPKFSPIVMAYVFRGVIPLLMVYAQSTVLGGLVAEFVGDKETKMQIIQLVNGVPRWLYWVQYFTYFTILSSMISVGWTIMFCTTCMKGCNPLLVFFGTELVYLQSFATSVLVSVFFDKQKTAGYMIQVLMYFSYVPIGLSYVPKLPHVVQYLTGFLPGCTALWWLQSVMTLKIITGKSWTWDGSFAVEITDAQISALRMPEGFKVPPAGYLWSLLWLQVGLWFLFAYWVDCVWQGEFGAAKPLTFCLQPRYLCPRRRTQVNSDPESGSNPLELTNLKKVFRRGKKEHVAVDGMNLAVRQREIFALLGHNGAGKTTAIYCITGITPITSGSASVMGYDCKTSIEQCRWNLSICPQDNPIYDKLSVAQHLRFFAALRGSRDPTEEIPQILRALGLESKLKQHCKSLSGGQKRRLWVATSLIGQAPLVFLDEPTSGMDPDSRRQLWELLLDMKERGRSIIFTTHYLEEADVLADRKAVLARGRVQAAGTSMELKRQFGVGYNLQIYVVRGAPPAALDEVRRMVIGSVASSAQRAVAEEDRTQAKDTPEVLTFDLPYSEVGSIGPLLTAIEDRAAKLSILYYDISMTSLEEVFMALGKEEQKDGQSGVQAAPAQEPELAQWVQGNRNSASFKDMVLVILKLRLRMIRSEKGVLFLTLVFPAGFNFYMLMSSSGWGSHTGNSIGRGFTFTPAMTCGFSAMHLMHIIVAEREAKIRHTMISQGLHPSAYWAGTLLEVGLHTLLAAVTLPLLAQALSEEFMTRGRGAFLWCLALLQPAPITLFLSLLSGLFSTPETAMKMGMMLVAFVSLTCLVPELVWGVAPTSSSADTAALLVHSLLSFLNPLYLSSGLITALWRAGGSQMAGGERRWGELPEGANFGTWFGHWSIWAPIVGQTLLSLVMGFFLTDTSRRLLSRLRHRNSETSAACEVRSKTDEDVLAEEERVRNITDPASVACLYRNLCHNFRGAGGTTVPAVRGISLGIELGEAFGLLGPNGAGKTTTLSCLTGEIRPPTSGEVYVAGKNVTGGDIFEAYKHLGFCPQVDPILIGLSGRQHLAFFGELKGVPAGSLAPEVNGILDALGFEEADKDKRADKYSGGMKRKLCLGIAMVGGGDVLFLDEPSAAVDAASKRRLWKVIKQRARHQTVVITTHSMEEADAVCDRIAIQVQGGLRCLGSPMHLKRKYGSGYQLEIVLDTNSSGQRSEEIGPRAAELGAIVPQLQERQEALTSFAQSQLATASTLLESHRTRFVFQLPAMEEGSLTFGQIFTKVHAERERLGIEAYSVTRPTLEQVFLRFAREQGPPEGEA